MADPVTIAAIGFAISGASAVGQAVYSSQAAAASSRAERLRERQMRLDAMKKRREAIRQSILASSMAHARSTAQGVGEGSSVLFGAEAQTTGELGRQINYTNQSEDIGAGIFKANADYASAQSAASAFNAAGSVGTTLAGNSQRISDIGNTMLFGASRPWSAVTTVTPTPPATPTLAPITVPPPFTGVGNQPY